MTDPNTYAIDISCSSMTKGTVREGMELKSWDCIQDCNKDQCPIGHSCIYSASSSPKCALQTEYLQSFVDIIFRTYKYIDEADMFKIGMHLVPLYSQLCRMKIAEKGVTAVTYEDLRGKTCIHPIFKEMRDTMKTISMLWKDLGFTEVLNPALPDGSGIYGRGGFGDPNHYAMISADSTSKRNVIR
jgi:hypothetical protein